MLTDSFSSRIQKLGDAARKVFPVTETLRPSAGDIFYDFGFLMGLLLWSFGCLWLFFAVSAIVRLRRFPFNLGWWAFTFPLGVFTTCTTQLGHEMPSRFFKVLGTVGSTKRNEYLRGLTSARSCRSAFWSFGSLSPFSLSEGCMIEVFSWHHV